MTFFLSHILRGVPWRMVPILAVLGLAPLPSIAQSDCEIPVIHEREALIRLALECNGAQQALDEGRQRFLK